MPSFDIVSKVDIQTLDNAINVARKELNNRYDLRDSKTEIDLDKKTPLITITTANEMSLETVIDIILTRMAKQGIDPKALDLSHQHYKSGALIKKELKVKTGVDKETSKKIIKDIKDSKIKVTASIMDNIIRVSGKKIDDLQQIIAIVRNKDYGIPLQFDNMKS
ncbi:MAG: YajQ family cyclic di-GMP-binding protein [Cytophagaceae bacterium]|nr:YajQ family cyclic di-GMP-binding protein [Cytophagaceae bacterium]MDW8455564.1 YajQ family cyclic di-GMP-binding protein [Cytophagaceae bacterium]